MQLNENWKYQQFDTLFDWCEKSKIGSRQGTEKGKYPLYIASATEIKRYNEYLVEGEGIVFGTGGNPCIHYVDGKFSYTNHTEAAQKKNDEILTKFYFYYFQCDRYKQLQSTFVGGGIKNSSKKKIGQLLVPVPPLPEQQRIVAKIEELFAELDNSVAMLKKVKEQLEVYRQAVLKEAFEGNLTINWRKENYLGLDEIKAMIHFAKTNKKSFTKMQETIALPEIPENWEWISIGDITNGVEYGTSQKSSKSGEIPVVRMGNIQNGKIDWKDLVYSSDKEEIEKYRLHYNDVLFNRTNSPEYVGKTAIYKGEREAIFAGYLIRINHFDCINSDYLTYYLNSFFAKQYSNKVKTDGVNQSNINGNKLMGYPFPLCSLREQEQIVLELKARLSEFNKMIEVVEKILMQFKTLRQSILKKAFEGEL